MMTFLSKLFPSQSNEVILMISIILVTLLIASVALFFTKKAFPEKNLKEIQEFQEN